MTSPGAPRVTSERRRGAGRVRGLDSASRSFFLLLSIVLVPYGLLGLFGCGLLSLAGYRLATEGLAGLDQNGQDLRPGLVLFAVVTSGTVAAAVSVHRQLRATRALTSRLRERAVTTPEAVAAAAEGSGLSGRVEVVDDAEPYSFTYGLVASRVVVSRGLVEALDTQQLAAVLHHERYHVRSWDTVKMVVARAAPAAFFFLPALSHLRTRYLAGRELAADRAAFEAVGARPLAGALYRVVEASAPTGFGPAAALGGAEFLELRVDQIETGDEPPLGQIPRWRLAATVAGLGLLSAAFLLTALGNGSMPMMGDADRPGGPALAVLGGTVCMASWLALGSFVVHRVIRHKPLTPRSH